MAFGFVSYTVENDKRLQAGLDRAAKATGDLSKPLTLIGKDFFRSRKAIFTLKGAGQYPDFKTEKSRKQKFREVGFEYPLLERHGALKLSVTDPKDKNAVFNVDESSGEFGTQLEYLLYHQSDEPRKKIPLRKILFIGPEAPRFAKGKQLSGFPDRALNTLNTYVLRTLGLSMEAATGIKPKIKKGTQPKVKK